MRSFAIWYNTKSDKNLEINKKLEVHINLFREHHKKNIFCFDFGLFIEDLEDIRLINLFLPFDGKNVECLDLGNKISIKNEKVINAIFNENYSVKFGHKAKSNLIETNPHNKPEYTGRGKFIFYSLEDKITKESKFGGTILQIETAEIPLDDEIKSYYFRLRVKVKDNLNIINDQVGENSFLQEAFTNIEIIDFRLNDVRSCGDSIKEKFENEPNFNITKIHYLILRNAKDEVIYYGGEMSSRILEKDLWKDYLDSKYLKEDMIAYHIKRIVKNKENETEYIKDFSSLVRFRYKKISIISLLWYFVVFIVLSSISAYISKFIK